MSFQTIPFFAFLIVLIFVLAVTKNEKIRQIELLLASFLFYGIWDWRFLGLLFLCIGITHISGRILSNSKNGEESQKTVLSISIVLLLIILGIFKYLKFFVSGLCNVLGLHDSFTLNFVLPIGISFYIFTCVGYLIDIYRGELTGPISLYQEALYIAFFPKILQGPFQKASDFFKQLKEKHPITIDNISSGIQIFLFGLIKKLVIADRLGLFVDNVYMNPSVYSGATLLLAALTYPMQLYCDFSGYSDMAVGVARMIGYELPQNFNIPFLSKNVAEYWRRWHMSLNIWFRDYLFYSLIRSNWVNDLRKKAKGRSKKFAKMLAPLIGMIIVWPLVGLWHGASWNYILYGCLYGLLMIVGLIGDTYGNKKNSKMDILRIIRTWIVTLFALIIFRAQDISTIGIILKGIFTWQRGISYIYTWSLIFVPVVMLICIFAYEKNSGEGFYIQLDLGLFRNKVIFCTVSMLTIILMYVGENYFMYFQF